MRSLLAFVVFLLLYVSLYPWHFSQTAVNPFLLPLQFYEKKDVLFHAHNKKGPAGANLLKFHTPSHPQLIVRWLFALVVHVSNPFIDFTLLSVW